MKKQMKKITALLLALVVMIPMALIGASADETPTTTPTYTANAAWEPNADGIFEISTPEDLLALATKRGTYSNYAGKTIVLTADIDLNPGWDASTKTEPANVWASMWSFQGTIDGQGHSIKGLYKKGGDNASFIVQAKGATFKDIKIENSYFGGAKNAGFVACVRDASTFTNVYVDAIVEADTTGAGGIVSWFFTSEATSPSVTFTGCVFAGSVSSNEYAGGILGTNLKAGSDTGAGDYAAILIDCANYGTVTSTQPQWAGGLVGKVSNTATFTRCYGAGDAKVALTNIDQTEAKSVVFEDSYFASGTDVTAFSKNEVATNVTVKYDGAAATDVKTATVAELAALTAFKAAGEYKGWLASNDGSKIMPFMVMAMVEAQHEYEAVVTPPTCSERGYTTYTCKKCGQSYQGDFVDPLPHTPSDWIIDNPATEEFSGKKHKECTVCGTELEKGVVPQLTPTETTPTTQPADDTTAADDVAETTGATSTDDKKDGCGASIALSSALGMSAIFALGAAVACKKRK